MKVYRFMSLNEFKNYLNGKVLINNKNHSDEERRTMSSGFCFMDIETDNPERAYQYLAIIVSRDVCVVFETNEKLNESYGIYNNPDGDFVFLECMHKKEYCINEYSSKTFRLIKFAFPEHVFDDEQWKWYEIKELL